MRAFLSRLRGRFGDFWWYSLLVFLSCRAGDAINAFIGLWLVPRYVPQDELGAALPLLQAGAVFGLPLSILVVPFSRWLTLYATRGETGKVKRLLSIAFTLSVVSFLAVALTARYILPLFFDRLRVAEGSLGFLIVCAGLVGPFSGVFTNALQGLKRFRALAVANLLGAPARLAVMLLAMPFRALSGYILGQMATPLLNVLASWIALARELGRKVRSVPLGRADVSAMCRYALPLAAYLVVNTLVGTWQSVLFRQRLPEMESAAYYILSRFAEIAAYAGVSLSVVVFPLSAEADERGQRTHGLLARLMLGTALPGLAMTLLVTFFGEDLLSLSAVWRPYTAYAGLFAALSLRYTLAAVLFAFVTYETAAGRFRFLWYWVPLTLFETGTLVVLTGVGELRGLLPSGLFDAILSVDAAHLSFFIYWLLGCGVASVLAMAVHIALRLKGERRAAH